VHEGWLEHDGVRLHYIEWEATDPGEDDGTALFLLHGLSANARYWERFAARFPHRRLVALDQRSHGASDRPPTGYEIETVAADAAHAIREIGLDRPVVAGHSWGCTTALALAGLHPDLVSGLAVIDGPVQPMSERLAWGDVMRLMQPPLPRYASLKQAYAQARTYVGNAWGEDLQPGVDAGFIRDGDAWVLPLTSGVRLQILRHMYDFQPQILWARLEVPALLALAGADVAMRSWKEEGAASVAEVAPGADVRWYDSRHDIPQIAPDPLAADVERLCLEAGFNEMARRLSELDGDYSRKANAGWSARDLLAHLASTQSAMASVVRAPAPTDQPGGQAGSEPFDSTRWNASQLRKRADLPVEALVKELESGTAELLAALRETDLTKVLSVGSYAGRTVASGMRAMVRHQHEHLAELESVLE
jgi:pimeloyl-ACP methyl ester carboxylesterase